MYKTYVMGSECMYDSEMIRLMRMATDLSSFTKMRPWLWYRSNWRILHIDGFEPGYGSRQIHWDFSIKAGPRR
jgi:hypothetical protein